MALQISLNTSEQLAMIILVIDLCITVMNGQTVLHEADCGFKGHYSWNY